MFYNDEFRQDVAYGLDNDIDINITNQNVNSNDIMNGYDVNGCSQSMMQAPIMEAPRERCVYRNIVHEVPQE